MIVLLLLAGVSRCAVATLCPSNADLAAAVYHRGEEDAEAHLAAARAKDPGDYVLAHAVPVRRIADVHCGDAEPGAVATVTCSFTARVGTFTLYKVAQLERRADGWTVVKELSVRRK